MNVLLISYEKPAENGSSSLNNMSHAHSDHAFTQRIKSQPKWARVDSTTYLVTTNLSASQMRDLLLNTQVNKFLVYDVTNALWAANDMPQDVAQWLQANWRQS